MIDIIYNFIRNDFIGETTLSGADNLALLLTWAVIIGLFMVLWRLVFWAFNSFRGSFKRGRYN